MSITIKIGQKEDLPKINLNIRKSLDGNFIIFDNPDIDIVVMPEKRKILLLTNDSLNTSSKTYDTQNKLFKFLMKRGVVKPESIHAGNVYGSMEATYPEIKDGEEGMTATDMVLLVISKWIEQERPDWLEEKEIKEKEIDKLTDPEPEDTTNLGKVGHARLKGKNFGGIFGVGSLN